MGSLKRGESQKFKFEDILCMVGENDRWQIIVFLFTWIEGCLIGFHHLSSSFLAASMPHWCNLDHVSAFDDSRLDSWTLEQKKQYALPYNDLTKSLHSCMVFDLSKEKNIDSNFTRALQNRPSTLAHLSCESLAPEGSRFSYDMSDEMDTIVNQWNLVCERLPLLSTIQGSYMGGVFVGCIFFGWASDRFGRRTTMLVAAVIQTVSSIAAAFATNYIIFIFLRFCIAFSVSGVFECGFVLVTEICGPKFRTYFGILTQFPFGIGAAMLPLIAYFVRDWQHLQLTISIPCICLCLYYWFVPESPRWLMAEGRYEEALKILKDGAKTNKRTLPPDAEMLEMLKSLHDEDEEEKTTEVTDKTTKEKVIDVFRELIILVETPEMRKRTLNIFYSWLVVAMVYYGLSFNTKNLGGNRYVSSFVSGFVEIPAVIMIIPLLNTIGRVKCYCGTFLAGGVCCGLVAIITFCIEKGEMIWLPVTVAMIGKFLISMTFAIAYLYTAELFPTKVRNVAVGTASTFARIGSISAPYIVDILGSKHAAIPVIIFGIASVTAGLFALMLPETLNKKMPDTVAEIERSGRRKKGLEIEEMNTIAAAPKELPDA